MTKEEYEEKMNKYADESDMDTECAHIYADSLLIEYIRQFVPGSEKFIDAYESVCKWYS